MLRFVKLLSLFIFFCGVSTAEWTSPHDLRLEEKAPNALIPFPREVSWEKDTIKLPSAKNWELKGKAVKL